MKISELILELENVSRAHGDLDCFINEEYGGALEVELRHLEVTEEETTAYGPTYANYGTAIYHKRLTLGKS